MNRISCKPCTIILMPKSVFLLLHIRKTIVKGKWFSLGFQIFHYSIIFYYVSTWFLFHSLNRLLLMDQKDLYVVFIALSISQDQAFNPFSICVIALKELMSKRENSQLVYFYVCNIFPSRLFNLYFCVWQQLKFNRIS